jgi:hypothetical protein
MRPHADPWRQLVQVVLHGAEEEANQVTTVGGRTRLSWLISREEVIRIASGSPIEHQQCRGRGRVQFSFRISQLGLGERHPLAERKQVALRS